MTATRSSTSATSTSVGSRVLLGLDPPTRIPKVVPFRRQLGLLALAPLALLRRSDAVAPGRPRRAAAAVALAVAAALVGAELAGGAQAFGARPRLLPPCATRSTSQQTGTDGQAQQLALAGLDLIACRLHKSREQLLVDVGTWGYKARAGISKWAHELHLPFG